ncbi:hypothetical protein CK203_027454 [Vitis vinifera]|uniref:BHLH domain-containing protein n=1 Tax=Vitis vinifera TaxID=29760 RepID=A0A438EAE7_VITVI|nr:hypothetical protein CK203_086911 [Vitis vinifera]RVX06218.1 hypothetical protein CK203_027454 [Vitis vinifera]
MPRHGSNLTQVDRKAVERERRMYMKDLFSRLAFLIPTRPSKVCLTSGLNKKFMLYQVIDVLVEEAAQVVALSYSIVGDKIFYTLSVQAVSSRIGIETSRVQERLTELIFQTTC